MSGDLWTLDVAGRRAYGRALWAALRFLGGSSLKAVSGAHLAALRAHVLETSHTVSAQSPFLKEVFDAYREGRSA